MFYIALDKANWSQLARIRNNIAGKLSVAIACCLFCSADLFFSYWPRFCAWKYITQTISGNVYVLCQGKFRTKTPCSLLVIKKKCFSGIGGRYNPWRVTSRRSIIRNNKQFIHIMKQKSILYDISNIEKWCHQLRHMPIGFARQLKFEITWFRMAFWPISCHRSLSFIYRNWIGESVCWILKEDFNDFPDIWEKFSEIILGVVA